jgi:hypothetical protein
MAHSSTFRPAAVLPAIQMWGCLRVWKFALTSNRGETVADAPAVKVSATNNPKATTMWVFVWISSWYVCSEFDRLDPQLLRQQRLVLPNLAEHRLGCPPARGRNPRPSRSGR